MTDYSVWRRCQWLVNHRMAYLVGGGSMHGTYRQLCRNRARSYMGKYTWLCRQHERMSRGRDVLDVLAHICPVAGRPDGEL
jgi:hypothetical protein